MPELIYLACPYSDADPLVEDARYQLVTKVAAGLIVKTGCEVFSPVTHSHLINRLANRYALEEGESWVPTYDFWLTFDYHMLDIAHWLYILKLKGWRDSTGVALEMNRFLLRKTKDNIKFIKLEDYL
jgi:hypothetical protein